MRQVFSTTLEPRDILFYQSNDDSTFIEDEAGLYYPIVLINETTIHKSEIIEFNLTVGKSFLPKINITIDDSLYSLREQDFTHGKSLLTFRISNSNDLVYLPIKFDCIILDVISLNEKSLTFICEPHIPNLHIENKRMFNGTSYSFLEQITSDCGLGLFTNIEGDTADEMTWLQTGTNYEMIQELNEHSYISDDNSVFVFIDQYMNLCVFDVQKAFNDRTAYLVQTVPNTGETCEEPANILLTTKKLRTPDDTNENKSPQPYILNWTANTSFGKSFINIPKSLTINKDDGIKNIPDDEATTLSMQSSKSVTSSTNVYLHTFDNENVHANYDIAPYLNDRNKKIITQGTVLNLNIQFYTPVIFTYMYTPVEVWNEMRNTREIDKMQEDKSLGDIQDEAEDPTYEINDGMSGDAIVLDFQLSYKRNKQITQHVSAILLNKDGYETT